MTHADTISAFLRQIIAHPDDDSPRLTFADWCEEHGRGERSEYIRLGCELEHIPVISRWALGSTPIECEHGFDVCPICDANPKRTKMARRAHELLTQHEPDWAGEFMPGVKWTYSASDRSFTFRDGGQAIFHWHRGFISQVECTLETWRGRTCERCGKETPTQRQEHDAWQGKCGMCAGTGRTGGIGPKLVRCAPIEAVVVTDVECWDFGGTDHQCGWWREGGVPAHNRATIPADLFDSMKHEMILFGTKAYPSAAAANAALSAVLLQEARETPLTEQKEKVYS